MATDVERLVVSLEASIRGFERTMNRATGVSDQTARKIEKRFVSMNDRMGASFTALSRGIAGAFAGVAALRGAQQLIDSSTRIENSLKVAGLAGEELTNVYDKLFASAQRNAAPVESLVTLYGRAAIVQKELGVSTEELLGFTDNVAVALRVAGTDAATASGALLQLSQALGAGTVRAEEFNSILEGALPVAQAAAAGLEEAGGSVAKLRALVVDGKVSSEAFFRAFEAGSVILTDKVANAELTVSQSFIRLQNVLVDVAGKFDNGTAASAILSAGLANLADGAQNFGTWLEDNGEGVASFFSDVSSAITEVQRAAAEAGRSSGLSGFGRFVEDLTGLQVSSDYATGAVKRTNDAIADLTGGATEADLAIAQAEQALATFALNGASQFGELEPVVEDFIQQLLEGKGTAESAAAAINAIGAAGDFGPLIGQLGGLVSALFAVRSEAVATAAAVAATKRGENASTNIAGQRAEQMANRPKPVVKPVSIAQYPVGGAAGGGEGGPGKGGGGGTSPGEKFQDSLAKQQERLGELNREIELRRQLGMAFDENGLAMQKLRVQMDLENEAARAGLDLTPERKDAIDKMATAYAHATVELDQLTEAQEQMQQAADDAAQVLQDGISGFVNDLIEGKDATEALGNALKNIGKKLLDSGLDALFSGLFGGGSGGGNLFASLFGGKGFAAGTANTGGVRGQARGIVHGQEAVIPLPNGGKVPVDVRLPKQGGSAGFSDNRVFQIDARGAQEGVADQIMQAIKQYDRSQAPQTALKAMQQNQQRNG